MSEIIQYKESIDPVKLAGSLLKLQSELDDTEKDIQQMYREIMSSNNPIEQALQKYEQTLKIGKFDTKIKVKYLIERMNIEDVVKLVSDVEDVDTTKMASIAHIVKKSNENMKKVAQLISGLSILTGMNYQHVRNISTILADLDRELESNIYASNRTSVQLKEFIYGQFNRMHEEKINHDNLSSKLDLLEEKMNTNTKGITNANDNLKQKSEELEKRTENNFTELKKWRIVSFVSLIISFISALISCFL